MVNLDADFMGLENAIVTNTDFNNNEVNIYITLKKKEHICPNCKVTVRETHDYRTQLVKDLKLFERNTNLIIRKRRYRCSNCGKRFMEENTFLIKGKRITKRLFGKMIQLCSFELSFSIIGKLLGISTNSVIRAFDYIGYPKADFKGIRAIGIDEFKGNTGGEKYNCVITDLETGRVIDILPDRKQHKLFEYFSKTPKEVRNKVEYFVSDMWNTYQQVNEVYFKKAEFIVDRYHWIRQMNWAFENIRKSEQSRLIKEERIYIKRSKSLLKPRFKNLTDEQKQEVNGILYNHFTISRAYHLKEGFYDMLYEKNNSEQEKLFRDWILHAQNSGLKPFIDCAKTYQNWAKGIKNSLKFHYSNGFTEGCNNKIKVLKRVGYGYRNFRRFRNRILHIFNYDRVGISL